MPHCVQRTYVTNKCKNKPRGGGGGKGRRGEVSFELTTEMVEDLRAHPHPRPTKLSHCHGVLKDDNGGTDGHDDRDDGE